MRRIWNKLRSRSGESLAELLISILIVTMATTMLVGMLQASANVSRKTKEKDAQFLQELNAAEEKREQATGIVTLTEGGTTISYDVKLYGESGDSLTAYGQ